MSLLEIWKICDNRPDMPCPRRTTCSRSPVRLRTVIWFFVSPIGRWSKYSPSASTMVSLPLVFARRTAARSEDTSETCTTGADWSVRAARRHCATVFADNTPTSPTMARALKKRPTAPLLPPARAPRCVRCVLAKLADYAFARKRHAAQPCPQRRSYRIPERRGSGP